MVIIVIVNTFIRVQSIMLHTMEFELREHSSNTNSYLMVVELEALLGSQVRIYEV
jgi:hypothetical protein